MDKEKLSRYFDTTDKDEIIKDLLTDLKFLHAKAVPGQRAEIKLDIQRLINAARRCGLDVPEFKVIEKSLDTVID